MDSEELGIICIRPRTTWELSLGSSPVRKNRAHQVSRNGTATARARGHNDLARRLGLYSVSFCWGARLAATPWRIGSARSPASCGVLCGTQAIMDWRSFIIAMSYGSADGSSSGMS
jgi:hypothetical protein